MVREKEREKERERGRGREREREIDHLALRGIVIMIADFTFFLLH